MRFVSLALIALVGLSGCIQSAGFDGTGPHVPETMVITGQGAKSGTVDRPLDCPADAMLSVVLQGRGDVKVVVTDAAGTAVHDSRYQDSQHVDVGTLGGTPGAWHVLVDFAMVDVFGQRLGSYEGQWVITFTC